MGRCKAGAHLLTFAPWAGFFPGRAYSPRPGFSLCPGSHCRRPSAAIPPQPGAVFSSFFQPRPGVAPKQARAGATPIRRRVFATAAAFLLPYSIYCVSAPALTGERSARPVAAGRAIFLCSRKLFHVEHFQSRGAGRAAPGLATNSNQ